MSVLRYAMRTAAAVLVAGSVLTGTADAQRRWGEFRQEQWQELDNRRVAPGTNSITLPVGRFEGRHTAIRLQVLDDPIFVAGFRVIYENGTQNEIPIRRLMRPGETTEPIDLEGGARLIREVRVSFQQDRDWRRTARLVLLGDIVERGGGRPPVAEGPRGPDRDGPGRSPIGVQRGGLPANWVLFGVEQAGIGGDRDTIYVGRERGRFDKIALRVRGNDVFLRDLRVKYVNGDTQDFPVNQRIRADERTAELALDKPQLIENIELTYSSSRRGGTQAKVEVWGEVAEKWLRGEGRDPGWLLAGTATASMFRRDNDTYTVGERFGRIKRVRFFVRNGEDEIRSVSFKFGNGDTQRVEFRQSLRRNETSQEITLPSRPGADGRRVESITIEHQSKPTFGGEASVEMWVHQ